MAANNNNDNLAAAIVAVLQQQGGNQGNDPTMRLSTAERQRALQIKEAVQADTRLHNLSDFQYVQWALAGDNDRTQHLSMQEICDKVFLLQCFRDEYRIDDTVQQGIELIRSYTQLQPGALLSVDYLASSHNYVSISDYAHFYPSLIQTDEQLRIFMGATFYILQCKNPNFQAIRTGVSVLTECMDAGFDNFDSTLMERLVQELHGPYPKNAHETYFLNSPTIANLTWAIWKRLFPAKVKQTFRLGYQITGWEPGQRLDALYRTPTPEQARDNMLLKIVQFLHLRYSNELSFTLDEQQQQQPAAANAANADVAANPLQPP